MLYPGFKEKGAHLDLLFIWRKTDDGFLFTDHAFQALDVFEFNRGIAAESHLNSVIIIHAHHVHRALRIAWITKCRNGAQSLLL